MKKVWGVGRVFLLLLIMLFAAAAAAWFAGDYAPEVCVGIAVVGTVVVIVSLLSLNSNIGKIINGVSRGISTAQSKALNELNVPVMIATEYGEIVWYNPAFEAGLSDAQMMVGKTIEKVFGAEFAAAIADDGTAQISYGNGVYSVADSNVDAEGSPLKVYYFFDITELSETAEKYERTRPVVALVAVDNIDEITKNARDSEVDRKSVV